MDDEKNPEFILDELIYGGTHVSSRYNKFNEIRSMVRALDVVNRESWRGNIDRIWCDSKANAIYSVECTGADDVLERIAKSLESAFVLTSGGFNGLVVSGENSPEVWVDPNWIEGN